MTGSVRSSTRRAAPAAIPARPSRPRSSQRPMARLQRAASRRGSAMRPAIPIRSMAGRSSRAPCRGSKAKGTVTYRTEGEGPVSVAFAPALGPLDPATRLGPRLAPPLAGIGRIGAGRSGRHSRRRGSGRPRRRRGQGTRPPAAGRRDRPLWLEGLRRDARPAGRGRVHAGYRHVEPAQPASAWRLHQG